MSENEPSPELLAYRLNVVEKKVDSLHEKIDILVNKSCPAPGSCITISDTVKRIEVLVEKHETRIVELANQGAFARGAIWASGIGGAILGAIVPSVVQKFLDK